MKYVRTEDRIIDVSYLEKDDKGNYYTWENDDFCANRKYIYKEDIIQQADTIEKLCDEFVEIEEDKMPLIIDTTIYPIDYIFEYIKQTELKTQIYGAIWNDKGLRYVTKMNDKGELELI